MDDKYAQSCWPPKNETEAEEYPYTTIGELEHAADILIGYQEIVFRTIYSELNALVELELKNLAQSILNARGDKHTKPTRGNARCIIEQEYDIKFEDLPKFEEVDEIRRITNAYKHDDGFTGEYKEVSPNSSLLFGYSETRYSLDWDKTYQSIQAVKEFMKALPGDRQEFRKTRLNFTFR